MVFGLFQLGPVWAASSSHAASNHEPDYLKFIIIFFKYSNVIHYVALKIRCMAAYQKLTLEQLDLNPRYEPLYLSTFHTKYFALLCILTVVTRKTFKGYELLN